MRWTKHGGQLVIPPGIDAHTALMRIATKLEHERAGHVDLDDARVRFTARSIAIERALGVLHLVDGGTIHAEQTYLGVRVTYEVGLRRRMLSSFGAPIALWTLVPFTDVPVALCVATSLLAALVHLASVRWIARRFPVLIRAATAPSH